MCRACWFCLERPGDNVLDPVIADLARRPASGLITQAIKTMPGEPLAPHPDGLARNTHRGRDRAVILSIGRAQDDLRALRIRTRDLAPADTSIEHSPLIVAELDRARFSIRHHRPCIADPIQGITATNAWIEISETGH
jgi:hypothetical protein